MAVTNNIPNTTDKSSYIDGSEYGVPSYWNIRIQTNAGYKFAGDGTVSYEDSNGDWHDSETMTVNMAKTMLSKNLYNTDENAQIEVNGSVVDGTILDVTNNIANTTATGKITGSYEAEIKVSCNNGFVFDTAPKVSYMNYNGGYTSADMVLNADKTEATATLTDVSTDNGVTLTGETVSAGTPELTVTNSITGGKTTETHTYDGTTATFEVVGNFPHNRLINPCVVYTDTTGAEKTVAMQNVYEDYKSRATASVTDIDPKKPVTLTGSYVVVCQLKTTLTNCTSANELPEYYTQKSIVEITLNANPNTEFNTAPVLGWQDDNGIFHNYPFTVSDDKATASVNFQLPDYNVKELSVYAEADPVTVVGGNYGAINVYVVTLDNLQEFAKVRFFKETGQGENVSFELIDLGKYVNRLKRVFVDVPTSSTDVIKCANWNTNINCYQPATDKITLDFGNVTVPDPNKNSVDFNSEIKIFIPFAGFVNLPVDYAGEQINLQIDVNIITGNGVARLQHNGVLFQTVELTPSNDVLFRTSTDITTIGEDDWNETLYYGVEPYLYCKIYTGVNNTGRNSDSTRAQIGTFTGFNTFADVTPIVTPTMFADEQRAIYEALKRGVYIE